jgi:hypothetical protein
MIKFYLSDLKDWLACPDGYEWAESIAQARGRDYVVQEDFERTDWLAWCYASAACRLSDARYDPRLLDTLIEIGDAEWIEWAACRLPDDRYDSRLIDTLIEIGDSRWIACAARQLPDARYTPRLLDALIDTRDAEWIEWAACWLPDARRRSLCRGLPGGIRTNNEM